MRFPELKNQVVVVIGGAQGIGQAIRNVFLAESACVVVADIRYEEGFKKAKDGAWETFIDITQEKSIASLTTQLKEDKLVPDILVHVAGISTMDYFLESQTADFEQVFAVNTRGAYLVLRELVKEMKQAKKRGRVIVIASQAGKNPYRGMSAYVASKHAAIGLTKNLALEVAEDGILVNAVCPGIIETQMKKRERVEGAQIRHLTVEAIEKEDASQVPIGRTGSAEEVANVVLFLASPLATYMTGQAINVTGGMTMV